MIKKCCAFLALILCVCSLLPLTVCAAGTAYDIKLDEITNPYVHGISSDERHVYSVDEMMAAKTEAFKRLQKDGIAILFEKYPKMMQRIVSDRILKEDPQADISEWTDADYQIALDHYDLSLEYPAPMMELSWYDYAISAENTGLSYAQKNISGYMFVITCDGQNVALLRVKHHNEKRYYTQYQDLPNNYCGMYQQAKKQFHSVDQLPILLTDPKLHQAVAFLTQGKRNGTVLVQNYLSSSTRDDVQEVVFADFQAAAINWNRDTMSMLVAADGSLKSGVMLEYNNLESYLRPTVRMANRERFMRAASVFVSLAVIFVMVCLILYRAKVRFLDADDPRRQFKNFFSLLLPKWLRWKS